MIYSQLVKLNSGKFSALVKLAGNSRYSSRMIPQSAKNIQLVVRTAKRFCKV